ncbi:hypothetical protein K1T71_007696 [Dendrolimus kikuchii]|uniref:Uncharacterized protein n=1 Tax=Dendrolimus kikuchii TaxID=765133 RepID=A0ACC1CZ00_9NEOP|nr:hypothetical protein K1T71_007696 [Dendrolimus kikuchii]
MGAAFSNIMYFSEKLSLWISCTAMALCIVITLLMVLALGIGLGYNYCFVDLKTRYKYVPPRHQWHYKHQRPGYYYGPHGPHGTHHPPSRLLREDFSRREVPIPGGWGPNTTTVSTHTENIFETTITEIKTSTINSSSSLYTEVLRKAVNYTAISSTTKEPSSQKMVIPIKSLDLISLLSKLRSENMNYSLQIII